MKVVFALFAGVALLGSAAAKAEDTAVCTRTQAVQNDITEQLGKACAAVTAADLLTLTRVAIDNAHVTELKVGDFAGLANLEILNIRSNDYTTLPEGLFKGLTKLKTLVIIATKLRYLPDDFLADTPNLEQCYCFRNQVRSISESVLQRLEANTTLNGLELDNALQPAEKARIQRYVDAHPQVDFLLH